MDLATMAMIANMGMQIGSGFFGQEEDEGMNWEMGPDPKFHKAPEYAEAEGARGEWWNKLQEWGGQEGYGAISPDWGDIWKSAQDKVRQHYWGGPGGQPGVSSKVKSSAARRGVAESPALETELTRMGMQEGAELGDIATEQAYQEALFGEQGRQNWMQQLMGLSQQKPAGMWQTAQGYMPGAESGGMGEMVSGLGSAIGKWGAQKGQQDWYSGLLDKYSKKKAA